MVRRSAPETTNVPAKPERVTRAKPGAFSGKPFAVMLSEAMDKAGISRSEAARRTGLPRTRITEWANGRREPGATRALWLIATLGLDLRKFLP